MPGLRECRREVLDRLAIKHKVRGLLASAVLQDVGVSSGWKTWAAAVMMSHERDQKMLDSALSKTVTLISERFEPPIVLKGASLAFGAVRDTGDVDLLINEQDLVPIIELLESKGYAYVGYDRNMYIKGNEYRAWEKLKKWSNQFEFMERETGTLIELHTAFFETSRVYDEDLSRLRAAIPEFTAACVTDSVSGCRYLCPEDRLLLLALHVVLKRSPIKKSFILRHLHDFHVLVSSNIDWEILGKHSKSYSLDFHLSALIHICKPFSGSLVPPIFLEALDDRLSGKERWLRDHFVFSLADTGFHRPLSPTKFRLCAPFILQGTTYAKLKSLLLVGHWIPPRFQLVQRYGLPRNSIIALLLYPVEPFRWLFDFLPAFFVSIKRRLFICLHP